MLAWKESDRLQYKEQSRDMLAKAGRKGGLGYANITLSKYPGHVEVQ
jgi:hypothetical protein